MGDNPDLPVPADVVDFDGEFEDFAPAGPGVDPFPAGVEPVGDPRPIPSFRVTDVTAFGARGTGNVDDREAVQAAVDSVLDEGGIIYFPAGAYSIGAPGLTLTSRRRLTLVGDGPASVLRRSSGAETIATMTGCTDVTITRLGMNGNNLLDGALIRFVNCHRVYVHHTRCYDLNASAPSSYTGNPLSDRERLAYSFDYRAANDDPTIARPDERNEDVWLSDNLISDMGIAVRQSRRVWIVNNTIVRAVPHGVVLGARLNNTMLHDVRIVGNNVIDPYWNGITAMHVGPVINETDQGRRYDGNTVIRLRIAANTIVKRENQTNRAGCGVYVGTLPGRGVTEAPSGSNRWRDVVVENNTVHLANNPVSIEGLDYYDLLLPSYEPEDRSVFQIAYGIYLHVPLFQLDEDNVTADGRSILLRNNLFHRPVVRNNTVIGANGFGIRIDNARDGEVAGNGVYESDGGIHLARNIFYNHIHDNRVRVSGVPYRIDGSWGSNVMSGNVQLPGGRAVWEEHGRIRDDTFVTDDNRVPHHAKGGGGI